MSLPFTRRIARAALLVAAGAAPVVGAAGSAHAVDLPQSTDLGGVSNLDGATLGKTFDSTARDTSQQAAETGGQALDATVPMAGETLGAVGATAIPAAQKAAGDAAGTAGTMVGDTSEAAAGIGGSSLPTESLSGNTLPTESLTSGNLPTDSLTSQGNLPAKGLTEGAAGQLLGGLPIGG